MSDSIGSSYAPSSTEPATRGRGALKIAAFVSAIIIMILLGRQLGAYVPQFAAWVDSIGIWGPIVFISGYALATIAFIPGSVLTVAAGAIFGLGKGVVYVLTGASIGAAGAFLVARYLARKAIERRIEGRPRFQAIDRAVAREGLKIVFLLRLSPVFPFNLLNYGLGLTRVRFRDYLIASVGMLPGSFLYVYYGIALGSLAEAAAGAPSEKGVKEWAMLGLGLVATIVVTTIVTRIARRALQEEVADE